MARSWIRFVRGCQAGPFLVAPVVAVGVDLVAGDELVGVLSHDADGGGGDKDEDFGPGVGGADAEVDSVGVAQGEFASVIDGVVADAEVVGGFDALRAGFGQGGVSFHLSVVEAGRADRAR